MSELLQKYQEQIDKMTDEEKNLIVAKHLNLRNINSESIKRYRHSTKGKTVIQRKASINYYKKLDRYHPFYNKDGKHEKKYKRDIEYDLKYYEEIEEYIKCLKI